MKPISLLPITLNATKEEIREYFHNSYDLFESLFTIFSEDSVFYRKSEPTRHPMIFYFGHTAVFYINKLMLGGVIQSRINPEFESLFAIGVDEMSWDDMNANRFGHIKVDDVWAYRNEVRQVVDKLICDLPLTTPITMESPWWIILMGIEHERIHIETSSVLHRQMPIEFIKPNLTQFPIADDREAPKNYLVEIEGKAVQLGKESNHHLYGWDNEYGTQKESVESFQASAYLVSNAEFMEFVLDGGYEKSEYWSEEGLKFLEIRKTTHPVFWIPTDEGYRYRAFVSEIEMPLSFPVDVNYLEAQAFCNWKSQKEGIEYSLPSEAQYRVMLENEGVEDVPNFDDTQANINFAHYFSSTPVNAFRFKTLYDVVGNVWQWSSSYIDGFEGFEVHPIYDDFSTPTFDTKHNLIKGGSWASTGNELMKHSRYAFRRHFYQHAGFRYIVSSQNQEYEKEHIIIDRSVAKSCEANYQYYNLSDIEFISQFIPQDASILNIGCSTGRSSFELSKVAKHITGIDFSARFISVAIQMQEQGSIQYLYNDEVQTVEAKAFNWDMSKCEFWQGDASNLNPNFKNFDVVIALKVDRLYNPRGFLEDIKNRLKRNGVVVIKTIKNKVLVEEVLSKGFKIQKSHLDITIWN
ncbi:MAG: 5-histidylcysteine sulfoxide synthase [Campylobacterales bacterium]|nr:5-histidylcysteine sulfoxide synthase [Campylobacterales bacterium]